MRWLLPSVFLAIGLYAWWQRPIDPPATGPRLTQGEGAVAVEAEAVAATASASEQSPAAAEPGPNIATARWAAELQYPTSRHISALRRKDLRHTESTCSFWALKCKSTKTFLKTKKIEKAAEDKLAKESEQDDDDDEVEQ